MTGFTESMSKKKDIVHSNAKSKEWQYLRTHRKCYYIQTPAFATEYNSDTYLWINAVLYLSGRGVEGDADERAEAESSSDGQGD